MWVRYLPGLLAVAGSASLISLAPPRRKVEFAILATLLGLMAMEAEYWLAHGFPVEEIPFFAGALFASGLGLVFGAQGGAALSIAGLILFAYVNIRYGAPYLLDYILPVDYALLLYFARCRAGWHGRGFWGDGRPEAIWVILTYAVTIGRTSQLDKWGWICGKPW